MDKLKTFVGRSFIGGVLVILPIVILIYFFVWLFNFVTSLIAPISNLLIKTYELPELTAEVFALAVMLVFCFLVGTLVSTGIGKWLHRHFDEYLVRLAPGYRMVRDIIQQFFGDKKDSPFTSGLVARAWIYGRNNDSSVTALITSQHEDGFYTVFVPTGPNPTSGLIFHLPSNAVEPMPNIPVDEAMRTIISCGAGSAELIERARIDKTNQE